MEIIAGKTRSNAAAAILSNQVDLEKAYVAALDAEGSALAENEKYLDSIQGHLDLFTNAVQTLWNNALSSDIIKGVVDLGTTLVHIVDKIGLIPTILASILAYKTAIGAVKLFNVKDIISYVKLLFTANAATQLQGVSIDILNIKQKLLNSTLVQAGLAQAGYTTAQAAGFTTTQLLIYGIEGLAFGFKNLWTSMGPVGWAILGITAALTAGIAIFNSAYDTVEELNEQLSELRSELSGLESDLESLNSELETAQERMAELMAMGALSFIEQEELNNLRLQTAELERQIELKQALANATQKQIVQTAKETIKKQFSGESYGKDDYAVGLNGVISHDDFWSNGKSGYEALDVAIPEYKKRRAEMSQYNEIYARAFNERNTQGSMSDQTLIDLYKLEMPEYANYSDDDILALARNENEDYLFEDFEINREIKQETLDDITDGINMVLSDMQTFATENGLSYELGDDEVNAFLDKLTQYQYLFQEAQGISAKSSAIESMFDDTQNEATQTLESKLKGIAASDKYADTEEGNAQRIADASKLVQDALNNTSPAYDRLREAMHTMGLEAEDVARYFIQQSQLPDSSTPEGITAQYQKGVEALEQFKDGGTIDYTNYSGETETLDFDSLFEFDTESQKWTAIDVQIAKVLQGADQTAREEFGHLIETVKNEGVSLDDAMQSFRLSGVQAGLELVEAAVVDINTSLFRGVADDIDGLIDTFGELGSALEDVSNSFDLLKQAQEEMNYSGHVSIETALQLMESTENWNDVLTISNGVIKLNSDGTKALINAKLNQIRTNIALEIQELETARAQIVAAQSGGALAQTLEESTNEAIRQVAANLAYLTELLNAFSQLDFSGAFSRAAAAKADSLAATSYTSVSSGGMSLAEIDQQLNDAYGRQEMMDGLTADNFESQYSSDAASGNNGGSGGSDSDNAFDKAMEYWENRLAANQARYDQIQNEIDLIEKRGGIVGVEYYEEQKKLEEERLSLLEQQKAAALAMLSTLEEGSEQWWEVANQLNDIEGEIDDVTMSIQDLNDAIADVPWQIFNEVHKRYDDLIDQLETIRGLLYYDEDEFFDDEGGWTEAGAAVLGTYMQEREMYQNALDAVNEEIANLDPSQFDSEQEYYDKLQELTQKQQVYTQGIHDSEKAVVDMYQSQIDAIEEYTDKLVESYGEYIDSVKEALNAERELYQFKKNVRDQTKNISNLERRIASLSGSDNRADIAERRRLQAELIEAKEGLNDTYYENAKTAQIAALDEEAEAYGTAMENYIESLQLTLDTATEDMDAFMATVTELCIWNSETILTQYTDTGLLIDTALTTPWQNAIDAIKDYEVNGLSLLNEWTKANGIFDTFKTNVSDALNSPWQAGITAVNAFKTSVETVMADVVKTVETNVAKAIEALSSLYSQIQDTSASASSVGTGGGGGGYGGGGGGGYGGSRFTAYQQAPTMIYANSMNPIVDGGYYYYELGSDASGKSYKGYYLRRDKEVPLGARLTLSPGEMMYKKRYAKGTLGTKRDEWAITDEPWLGNELTMYATPQGTLSYMRAGSTVIPADLTKELMDIGELGVEGLTGLSSTVNGVKVMSNVVNQPNFNLSFGSLLHIDNCTQEVLPSVEKLVDTKLDKFTKQLNYSLKKFTK